MRSDTQSALRNPKLKGNDRTQQANQANQDAPLPRGNLYCELKSNCSSAARFQPLARFVESC